MKEILEMMLEEYSDKDATIYHDDVVVDIKKLQEKVRKLENLLSQLKTNEDVDWSVEDANWEFMELSKTLEQILNIDEEDCENCTNIGDCSSSKESIWHNETLQQLGDDRFVNDEWVIKDDGVAIDCYPRHLEPIDGDDFTYLWLHGAGWTDDLVHEVIESELYKEHPVYLIEDRGYILCGDKVYYILDKGLIPDNISKIGKMFDFEGCEDSAVDILCEGGE